MGVLYGNFLAGTITDAPLLIGATTVNSAAFANLPTVASPDTMWLVLDPEGSAGAPEIVQITAHTAAATSCTIVRAQQSTTAREHLAATVWRCALTKSDADSFLTTDDLAGYATTAYADALGTANSSTDTIVRRASDGNIGVNPAGGFTAVSHVVNRGYVDGTTGSTDSGNVQYKKDSAGWVTVWFNTTSGGAITIGSGFRPVGKSAFAVVEEVDGSGNPVSTRRIRVATSGVVSSWSGSSWVNVSTLSNGIAGSLAYKV